MDKRTRQFLELLQGAAPALLERGFVQAPIETDGQPDRRPYSVRVRFHAGVSEVRIELALAFAGEEVVFTQALHADRLVLERTATAHKGQEIRKALASQIEAALAALAAA